MFKLLKLAFVVGALAAVWMLVPIGGRTLDARWKSAGSPGAFARAAWAELDRALSSPPPPSKGSGPAGGREKQPERAARPSEAHTERDRQAVDRIVADRLRH